jgi:hypothetical protein
MYLISKGNQKHGFGDFFPLEEITELKVRNELGVVCG